MLYEKHIGSPNGEDYLYVFYNRDSLRLNEFRPKVLTSFVRNRLINDVYLPLVGDNLAKQIGAAGSAKRTDLMGMLLLISPPGYGKTTLMEYVANRLGLIFMKVNGPAIGHRVTSLDPVEAPNASAHEELHKLNIALELGDNDRIYVDDIQHCNAEFLQKFISLCDAQRKIEGVWQGRPRTYDLRGRKVCVVMAGNPYTESGEKFQIPDMLANRADTYNLGEIIGDNADSFELSFLENCLTANQTLSRLAARSQQDVYNNIRIAETGRREGVEFEENFTGEEISEMVSVMEKLIKVRENEGDGVAADDKAAQAIMQLAQLGSGLEAIRDTLNQGLERLNEDGRHPRPVVATFDEETLATFQELGDALKQAQLEPDDEKADGEHGEHKIEIINQVPRVLLNVMQSQFQLMAGWLQPLMKNSAAQNAEMKNLARLLGEQLKHHQALMEVMNEAARRNCKEAGTLATTGETGLETVKKDIKD